MNDFSFNQLSTILNQINSEATGTITRTPVNTNEFVSVGQNVLKRGYDPVMNAISQVIGRTIFSIRPYTRMFKGLEMTSQQWGSITRKIRAVDKSAIDSKVYALTDGEAIDQQIVSKPDVIETNFYGANIFSRSITIFDNQLNTAFASPEGFSEFLTMMLTNVNDTIEQSYESMARMTLVNLMAGIIAANKPNQVVHLLTAYNAATGSNIADATALRSPANYSNFMKWAHGYIAALANRMRERSSLYHFNLDGKPINTHTPYERMKVYLTADEQYSMDSRVLADAFHDNYLKYADVERVTFWQDITAPSAIEVKPSYLDEATGVVKIADEVIKNENIFGVIFDEEAAGINIFNQSNSPAPHNARGNYTNLWWNWEVRYFNDFMENAVVLLLD